MIERPSRARWMAATAVVGTLMLGGCGGDDAGADPVDSTAATSDDGGADPVDTTPAASDDGQSDVDAPGDATGDDDSDEAGPDGSGGATGLEDLVPPGVVGQNDLGTGVLYRSEAAFEDLVAHYESVIGDANFVNPDEVAATWVGAVDSTSVSVNLSAGEGALVNVLVSERG